MPDDIRGSWRLEDAIRLRWNDADLDSTFREAWDDPDRTDVMPFNDTEGRAEENHPRPYCVVEYGRPITKGNSTGKTGALEITYMEQLVTFHVHGTTKAQARAFGILVANAFTKKRLTIVQDRFGITIPEPDFSVREGDRSWVRVLPIRFRTEGDYPAQYT